MPRRRDRILDLLFNRSRNPSPTPPDEMASVAWEGVKTATVLLKESSDWFPPLKAATGGFLALIDAIELTSSHATDLELLRQKINDLTSIIKENSQDRSFPWLLRRLSQFTEKLNEILKNVDEISDHRSLRRTAEGKKDRGDITVFAGVISDLVSNLRSELTLYTSCGINELLSSKSLKKLKESEAASFAAFDSARLVQRRGCTPNTRQKILEDLMEWAKDTRSSRLYWMNGMAGTGKTTIAYSFCEQLQDSGLLGANFFCSRSLAECSDIRHIIPTTARQLARSCPQFAPALLEVLGANSPLPSLGNHIKRLLSEPFQHISGGVTDTLIVVIDALDECSNSASEIRLFLEQICNYFKTNAIPLKVFVTSRPEDVISRTITLLKPSSPSEWSVVRIHDIEESLVQADIKVYVEDELINLAETWGLDDGWPPSTEVDAIVGNANKSFIYAATMIRYVKEDNGDPCMRLSEMASTSQVGKRTSQSSSLKTALIDELYMAILERAVHRLNEVENQLVRMVLKLIVCAQTPLTLVGIADLLIASGEFEFEIPISRVRNALKLLHSVVSLPMDGDGVAATFHASFSDFLFDSRRCGTINHIPFRQSHQDLARMCLYFMDKSLTVDNISESDRWQSVDAIVEQKKIEGRISSALTYACMFWASHIDTGSFDEIRGLSKELDRFLSHQVLRWLEVLSLLRRLDTGLEVLQRMKECEHPTLSSKFDDAYKFLKDIFDIINVWPCEVFHSGLVWAPQQSFIRKTYLKTMPIRMVCGHRTDWGSCELTIRGHSSAVHSVAVLSDNRRVVSGSSDSSVRIWNSSTGEEEYVLRGHSGEVNSVTISPDNRYVVSGSFDKTIRIWELTGGQGHVLRGHFGPIHSVSVSTDNRVVSGSSDKTIRIWNASTGEEERVLRGHSGPVYSVTVFPDNRLVVSGSSDSTVRIWNASTGEEEHVLRGHSGSVYSVAVSPDTYHIVSGSSDKTIRTWNASTGEEGHVLRGHFGLVSSVAVSPDNHHVASGSWDKTVRIWNLLTGEEEGVFRGHSALVYSVAVSPDNCYVVSGSSDNTVRIWSMSAGGMEDVVQGHSDLVYSATVSPDNHHIVSGSSDKTVRIWNASTGEEEHVLKGHSGSVYTVAVSSDNHHVVSGSSDKTVRIWNTSTGEEEHVLRGHSTIVYSVTVSPDNHHVVSGSSDNTVRIWNLSTGEIEQILRGHAGCVKSVAVSTDNRHVVSGSTDNTVRIWNVSTGEEERVLRGHSGEVNSVAFSLDDCRVVSGSLGGTVRIWNVTDNEVPLVVINIPDDSHVLSSMVTSIARSARVAYATYFLASRKTLALDILLKEVWNGPSFAPVALSPDRSCILLSNGKKCLAIPSTLRDIRCTAFSGSKVFFGHGSGQITILDIFPQPKVKGPRCNTKRRELKFLSVPQKYPRLSIR